MAKIRDLANWLISVRGDEGQVRSLVKILRADGQFSASGRGRGSPDMSADDFATAMACALSNSLTTHIAENVRAMLSLKTFSVSVDPGDGGSFREFTVWNGADELPDVDHHGNRTLPPELPSCPATLGEALVLWVAHFTENPASGISDQDNITFRITASTKIEMHLHNPDWKGTAWGDQEGVYSAYAWRFLFEPDHTVHDPVFREVETKLNCFALRSLADLARGSDD